MSIQDQIADILQANFEGLPVADRIGAASALSTLCHFVVDNDVEQDYCTRAEVLAAADRCYTALLMSYVNCDSAAQATRLLLAQADLVFGLQAVPNRRRVDCFLASAKRHLATIAQAPSLKPQAPNPKAPSPNPTPHVGDLVALASLVQTFGGELPPAAEALLATYEEPAAQPPRPTPHAGSTAAKRSDIVSASDIVSKATSYSRQAVPSPAGRFSALQNTINKLEEEIQASLFIK